MVFTAVKIQVVVFCVVTSCWVVVGYQRFGGPRCLRFQGDEGLENMRTHIHSYIRQHITPINHIFLRSVSDLLQSISAIFSHADRKKINTGNKILFFFPLTSLLAGASVILTGTDFYFFCMVVKFDIKAFQTIKFKTVVCVCVWVRES
jgi:hypothetical protein